MKTKKKRMWMLLWTAALVTVLLACSPLKDEGTSADNGKMQAEQDRQTSSEGDGGISQGESGNKSEAPASDNVDKADNKPSKEELLKDMNDLPYIDFTLKDIQGKEHTLSDYKGKIIVLNFWASWCPPCREEMPELEQFYKGTEGSDVVFLSVNLTDTIRETEKIAKEFVKDNGYTFPVLLDVRTKVTDQYGVRSIPTTFIIDKDGIIRYYINRMTDKYELDTLVEYVRIVQEE